MAGRPRLPDGKRAVATVRLSEKALAWVEVNRGALSRSAFLRLLVVQEMRRRGGPAA